MKFLERIYKIENEEALQKIEERLFDENLFNFAVEFARGEIFLRVYDRRIEDVLQRLGYSPEDSREVDPLEWTKNILKDPFEITEGVLIVPSENAKIKDSGKIEVHIPPGLAFGTGIHPTTRICAFFLKKAIKGGERVLDVGTGTGILAILAKKLGAKYVLAVDNDPLAVEVAKENVERNGVEVDVIESDLISAVKGKFDVVVANIVSPVLERLSEDVKSVCEDSCLLIISGIFNDEDTVKIFESKGFELLEVRSDDEWIGAMLRLSKNN